MSDLKKLETEAREAILLALKKMRAFRTGLSSECSSCAIAVAEKKGNQDALPGVTERLTNTHSAIQRLEESEMWFERSVGGER